MSYAGRTVDLVAYYLETPLGETKLGQDLARPSLGGEICTGPQKLAQRFLIKLFTITGSVKYRPTDGCNFMSTILSGNLRSSADTFLAFSVAVATLRRQFVTEDLLVTQRDEQFKSAELQTVKIQADQITLYINLTSQAGTSAVAILPISASV